MNDYAKFTRHKFFIEVRKKAELGFVRLTYPTLVVGKLSIVKDRGLASRFGIEQAIMVRRELGLPKKWKSQIILITKP